ncbi:hypothetical protein OAU50_06790 [Planctomycetota bacterium]|nr:hypothetical protein [Planctomycetota bacterium]
MKAATEKLALQSPKYAQLLRSTRAREATQRVLSRSVEARRKRIAFENILRAVS